MTVLTHALALAARGVPTFPCLASKAPACPRGFLAATADPNAVRALHRRHPGPLLGVPTGQASGFDVLDVDPRHGGDAWLAANRDRLPVTRQHATRSGGWHVLFRHHDGVRNSASKIAPGIDVRGEGGFVVWWPAASCAVPVAGPVAPWPSWLLPSLLLQPPAPCPVPSPRVVPLHLAEAYAERAARTALARLEAARPGERHPRLCAAARTLGGLLHFGIGESEATAALLAAARRAGGDAVCERNALATIASGLRIGAAAPLIVGGRDAGR